MALLTTFATNPVKTIIVNQASATVTNTAVGDNNVSGGPAYLHLIEIDNASFGTDIYVKLYDAAAAIAGTDSAEVVLFVKGLTKRSFQFFPGLHFATGLTMCTTTNAGQGGTSIPSDPPAVNMVLSETAS
tara:strand:+ start:620 stop:1009 length:390 start_codon:yes stop_codon:yes gene_type:complete